MNRLGPLASAQPKVPRAEPGTKFRPAVLGLAHVEATRPRCSGPGGQARYCGGHGVHGAYAVNVAATDLPRC